MTRIHDVAAYLLDRQGSMATMKLQTLCYYAYGYHLAWEKRPLFGEAFEAWANGPVSPDLYERHQGSFQMSRADAPALGGDRDALDPGERESVDIVLAHLGGLSAHELCAMAHRQSPWTSARERAAAATLDRTSERLHDEEIHAFFDTLTAG